jgi:hypothetical protein
VGCIHRLTDMAFILVRVTLERWGSHSGEYFEIMVSYSLTLCTLVKRNQGSRRTYSLDLLGISSSFLQNVDASLLNYMVSHSSRLQS